ncbi:hypothetical protein [Schumannella luteola]
MDTVIDVDAGAEVARAKLAAWARPGAVIGELTWRDASRGWPWVILTDRSAVVDPDSVGFTIDWGHRAGDLVLFRGGWCDLSFRDLETMSEPLIDAPGAHAGQPPLDLPAYGAVVDRFLGLFADPSGR